jgi:hypothetical protein
VNRVNQTILMSFLALMVAACSGDNMMVEEEIISSKTCNLTQETEDIEQDDSCGSLLIGLTDADGDFLNYTVDVTGLMLTKLDGTVVSAMTSTQSVNFVDYVELTELVAAATIPAGIYTGGSISFDYTNADIQVEKDGVAAAANLIDSEGLPLTTQTLQLQFDQDNRLVIARNRPAMLELDFNLAASHTVNLNAEPITITTEAYIIAEVDPVLKKEFRMRGPLINVNETESLFRIAVRPFHRTQGRFGGLNIHVNEETNYNINESTFVGTEGLAQMATLAEGTATKSLGVFNRAQNRFTALSVMAGSAVPGSDKDAVTGAVVARNGNTLTVKGASLIRMDGTVTFHDVLNVIIADTTIVSKPRRAQDEVTIADLSIGQAVTILGDISISDESDAVNTIDATEGAIRMHLTYASGFTVANEESLLTLDLQSLQGRDPDSYDFSGTGIDESFDAEANNYQVSVEDITLTNSNIDSPVRVAGFVNSFGSAPADFNALSVVDYSDAKSQLLIDWPEGESFVTALEISAESLVINTESNGGIYQLIQGGMRTDLSNLESAVTIYPNAERGIYSIKADDTVIAFSDFLEFTSMLQRKLDEGMVIDGLHAIGGYTSEAFNFSATKLAVKLN